MHITIHAYKDGEYIRAITLGMAKLGLPDIEVSDFSWSDNRSVGNLINLVAQLSYEIGTIRDIFDYIHRLPDGTSEGDETGALIQKYSQ